MKSLLRNYWILLVGILLPWTQLFAEEAAHGGPLGNSWSAPLGIGVGIGLAVIGAAAAQGKIAASFMEGVSRNPGAQKSMFVPMILALAFAETLVLFTIYILNSLAGKI